MTKQAAIDAGGTPDYEAIGSELDCQPDPVVLRTFAVANGTSTDQVLRTLAAFAAHSAAARDSRLAGRIQAALSHEAAAEREYTRLPVFARW